MSNTPATGPRGGWSIDVKGRLMPPWQNMKFSRRGQHYMNSNTPGHTITRIVVRVGGPVRFECECGWKSGEVPYNNKPAWEHVNTPRHR